MYTTGDKEAINNRAEEEKRTTDIADHNFHVPCTFILSISMRLLTVYMAKIRGKRTK